MAAPTVSAYSNSNFVDSSATETTGSVSWTSGDVVVVLGVTEDNGVTMAAPTTAGTGLSFSALTSFPSATGSNCKVYGWSATASASSSGTITNTNVDTSGNGRGLAVWVMSGSDGVGNTAVFAGDTTDVYGTSLTRAADNSFVLGIFGDWSAISDTTVSGSPATNVTERVSDNAGFYSGVYNGYAIQWGDQGASGSATYGLTGITGAKVTGGLVEVKGTAGGGGGGGKILAGQGILGSGILTGGALVGGFANRSSVFFPAKLALA